MLGSGTSATGPHPHERRHDGQSGVALWASAGVAQARQCRQPQGGATGSLGGWAHTRHVRAASTLAARLPGAGERGCRRGAGAGGDTGAKGGGAAEPDPAGTPTARASTAPLPIGAPELPVSNAAAAPPGAGSATGAGGAVEVGGAMTPVQDSETPPNGKRADAKKGAAANAATGAAADAATKAAADAATGAAAAAPSASPSKAAPGTA